MRNENRIRLCLFVGVGKLIRLCECFCFCLYAECCRLLSHQVYILDFIFVCWSGTKRFFGFIWKLLSKLNNRHWSQDLKQKRNPKYGLTVCTLMWFRLYISFKLNESRKHKMLCRSSRDFGSFFPPVTICINSYFNVWISRWWIPLIAHGVGMQYALGDDFHTTKWLPRSIETN